MYGFLQVHRQFKRINIGLQNNGGSWCGKERANNNKSLFYYKWLLEKHQ